MIGPIIQAAVPSKGSERSCIHVLGMSVLLLFVVFRLDFGVVPTV